ncbi:hypothetical protein CLV62_10493 [Dysgonomonas alginatilytica]|uniref:Uncharacterized protein n=1 Tax=Dysgonomonas alginatilytica TaxID=1605892 RepID=A0A2V3PYG8_9BACT|nr:hypothetical protein [Dysgonomonas alginatilytica]PXV66832.1 hypothetical protein CLV62_10493 [Dysgonomonas alginatilytica]
MKKISIKAVINSDNWIITKIIRGYNGVIRINAKTRFYIADSNNLFCEWCSEKYADALCKAKYGKKASELNAFRYN